jgi:hypothetical protein
LILNADVVMNIWNKSIVKKLIEKEFSIVWNWVCSPYGCTIIELR